MPVLPAAAPPDRMDTLHGNDGYGADKHGLIWGYLFAAGQPPREVDSLAAAEWLTQPRTDTDSFLWLHFSLSHSQAVRWMRAHLQLADSFYESLTENAVSTRLEQDDDALSAVILDVMLDANLDSSNISSVSLSITPQLLVSARLRPLRSVDRLRASVRSGKQFSSSAELLAQLLREQADVLVNILREATAQVDLIEDQLLAQRIASSRRELGALRRLLVRLQRLLAPEPASLFRLLNRPPRWIRGDDLQELRHAAEEFASAVADSAALAERVKLLQEEFTALISEQSNRTLFVLTLVTVLALPINLVAGLFGMNVGGIPLANHPHGFVLVIVLLVLLTGTLAYLVRKRLDD